LTIMNVIEDFHKQINYDLYIDCNEKFYNAENCIECCSKPYYERIQIDYTCPQKRKIYVARYAPTHISEISEALSKTPTKLINDIFRKNVLTVASIGGGPGTDIAAFNNWLYHSSHSFESFNLQTVRYLRLDIHEHWNDISIELINLDKIKEIKYKFCREIIDISAEPINPQFHDRFDVIILSYIFSEIDENKIKYFAKNVFQMLSEKTLIIVNDRAEPKVEYTINQFFSNLGINAMDKKYRTSGHCGFSYPDDIRDKVQPKLSKNSVIYNILIQK